MNEIRDLIIDKLQKLNYEIMNEKDIDENDHMIATSDSIITINKKKKEITISFHVSTRIEDSAILALTLNEIRGCKIFITEAFIFDDDGKYVDGDKALEIYEGKKAEIIIKDFVKYQTEKNFLMQSEGYKC